VNVPKLARLRGERPKDSPACAGIVQTRARAHAASSLFPVFPDKLAEGGRGAASLRWSLARADS
jgi:hypothetical protein